MYAAKESRGMKEAISETNRRRAIQKKYNDDHKITPLSIKKAIRDSIVEEKKHELSDVEKIDISNVPPDELSRLIKDIELKMKLSAQNLQFEKAAEYRDQISEIREQQDKVKFSKKIK